MKRIFAWEPWFFIFFGVFHMHRIWALVDRQSYADFWMGIYEKKGVTYFILMGLLAGLCILGIVTFIHECKANYIWRWIYVFGGAYVLFDLFAIAIGLALWNPIWIFFIVLGCAVFVLGIRLLVIRKKEN